jgi:hypothetical protein
LLPYMACRIGLCGGTQFQRRPILCSTTHTSNTLLNHAVSETSNTLLDQHPTFPALHLTLPFITLS